VEQCLTSFHLCWRQKKPKSLKDQSLEQVEDIEWKSFHGGQEKGVSSKKVSPSDIRLSSSSWRVAILSFSKLRISPKNTINSLCRECLN